MTTDEKRLAEMRDQVRETISEARALLKDVAAERRAVRELRAEIMRDRAEMVAQIRRELEVAGLARIETLMEQLNQDVNDLLPQAAKTVTRGLASHTVVGLMQRIVTTYLQTGQCSVVDWDGLLDAIVDTDERSGKGVRRG